MAVSPALRWPRASYLPKFRPDANTVLWLPGQDDPQSSIIRDRSGGGNDLTLTGATWVRVPRTGLWVLSLDGDDYVSKSVANFRSSDSSGCFACWFKTSTTANQTIFVSADTGTDVHQLYILVRSDDVLGIVQSDNDANDAVKGTTNVVDGKWHLAGWVSTGTAWILYLDGVAEGLSVTSGSNSGDWFADTTLRDNIGLGARLKSTNDNFFNGQLALARVTSDVPTASQALGIYNSERGLFDV